MQQSYDQIRIAVRVLGALTEHRCPYGDDIAALRAIAGPGTQDLTDDELACKVIHEALDRRAAVRSKISPLTAPLTRSHL